MRRHDRGQLLSQSRYGSVQMELGVCCFTHFSSDSSSYGQRALAQLQDSYRARLDGVCRRYLSAPAGPVCAAPGLYSLQGLVLRSTGRIFCSTAPVQVALAFFRPAGSLPTPGLSASTECDQSPFLCPCLGSLDGPSGKLPGLSDTTNQRRRMHATDVAVGAVASLAPSGPSGLGNHLLVHASSCQSFLVMQPTRVLGAGT